MNYVMDDREKIMYALVHDQGVKETVSQTIRVTIELAHTMSDLGLKERAISLLNAAELLKGVRDKIGD